jgi:hypothetical protein
MILVSGHAMRTAVPFSQGRVLKGRVLSGFQIFSAKLANGGFLLRPPSASRCRWQHCPRPHHSSGLRSR